ncbi:putative ABC transport system permease protein [Povalibacter uvarum]|uniref:Putative ABC transport system permease protein n=1 Tax=Povalibacter uvarum TaxID=732238 RepID=A0A841HMN2_9GAMM|nr:FtsX-like permease family protein [Povalibacter uvarum]MBB6094521.1 putative ABC transport system permease protein [Povalibacter uvarum]
MAGTAVLDAGVFGPLRHAPGRTALAVVAIALGVALGFAIYLINRVAADEVSLAARSLFGMADLAVEATGDGFDEGLYPIVARVPGVEVASPVVQIEARMVGRRGVLTLLGMDVFRSRRLQPAFAQAAGGGDKAESAPVIDGEPIFLSASAARTLGAKVGERMQFQVGLEPREFQVAAILPRTALEDRAAIIDIATAQWQFERLGRLSRLNLRLAPGANVDQVRDSLAQVLPEGVRVVTPGQAADDALRLSRAYRSNLTALALVALFTGGFFVYSTQSLAALRRRREFALLHALGVTRREQLFMALVGGGAIGAAGALVGIAGGFLIAQLGLTALGTDLGAGYFRGGAPALEFHWHEAVAFCALGIVVAVAGTLQPALQAANVPTATALKAGDVTSGDVRSHFVLIAALFVLAAITLFLPPVAGLPLPGYVSIGLLIIGTVVAMPAILRSLLAHAPALKPVPWEIAIAHLRGTARYATLSVSAIVVSFSLMVAMAIMVTSFRTSLDLWVQRILPADVYLRSGYIGQSSHLDQALLESIRGIGGIERLETSRFAVADAIDSGQPLTVIAREVDASSAERVLWLEAVAKQPVAANAVPVWISEAAADQLRLGPDATFDLLLAGRKVTASIRGIWRDYEHPRGAVIMDRATYESLTGDGAINTIWIWLKADASIDDVQRQIRERMPAGSEYDLRIPQDLRRLSLQAFDRTFAVTYALECIAILIGLFGISAGTSAQVLARRREFGVLRHIGLTRQQIASTLAIEGAGLGALGVLVGLITGACVSLILIYVVNRQSFHWSMDLYVPFGLLGILSSALIAAGAVIAVVSGRQAMRGDVIAAVKEDW